MNGIALPRRPIPAPRRRRNRRGTAWASIAVPDPRACGDLDVLSTAGQRRTWPPRSPALATRRSRGTGHLPHLEGHPRALERDRRVRRGASRAELARRGGDAIGQAAGVAHLHHRRAHGGPRRPAGRARRRGRVELVVRRPAHGEREVLDEGTLDLAEGLVGDNWSTRGAGHTRRRRPPTPGCSSTSSTSGCRRLVAVDPERRVLAGDQLHVDLDLSEANLPPGTRLALGPP